MNEDTKKTGEKVEMRNEKGQFVEGHPPIEGAHRPLGSRDFATDFDEAVEEIAKVNNITISEARKILLKRAYAEAKDGRFPFYKDIMDRYYGETKKLIDLTSKGEKIGELDPKLQAIIKEFEDKLKDKLKDE